MGRPLPNYVVNSIKCTCKTDEGEATELTVVRQNGRGRFIVSDGNNEHEIVLVSKAQFEADEELGTGYIEVTDADGEVRSLSHLTKNLIYFFEDVKPATFFFDIILGEDNQPTGVFQPDGFARIKGIPNNAKGTVRFTINPTPENATVKLNNIEQPFVDVAPKSEVSWEVSAAGYTTRNGKVYPETDSALDVILEVAAAG